MSLFSLFLFCGLLYALTGLGVSICYHRLLSHHSFQLKKPFLYFAIFWGLPAGTPVQWVACHRSHHAHTDEAEDPHSPIAHGFLYAHVGWYLGSRNIFLCMLYALGGFFRTIFDAFWRPRTNQYANAKAKDIAADPVIAWMSSPLGYGILLLCYVLFWAVLAYALLGVAGFFVFWGMMVFLYNIGDAISSLSHLYGEKLDPKSEATNLWWLALLSGGEAWHANHHRNPRSARLGGSGQFDLCWWMIRGMERVGLVSRVLH